jgi:hypothetical protein
VRSLGWSYARHTLGADRLPRSHERKCPYASQVPPDDRGVGRRSRRRRRGARELGSGIGIRQVAPAPHAPRPRAEHRHDWRRRNGAPLPRHGWRELWQLEQRLPARARRLWSGRSAPGGLRISAPAAPVGRGGRWWMPLKPARGLRDGRCLSSAGRRRRRRRDGRARDARVARLRRLLGDAAADRQRRPHRAGQLALPHRQNVRPQRPPAGRTHRRPLLLHRHLCTGPHCRIG